MTEPDSTGQDNAPAYGTSLSKAEPYGTEYIPDNERHGHPFQQFTTWFAANMVLAVLVSGFFASSFGLSLVQSLSAVAVGTALGAIVMGLLAGMGTRLGVPLQVQARGPMGYFANFVPVTLLTVFSAVGWTAVNTVFAVIALRQLVDVPFWTGAVVIFAIQGAFAAWGYNLIHLLNKIASGVIAILFLVITGLSLTKATAMSSNPDAPLYIGEVGGWVTFAGFFFVYIMTWTPFASDFSRYLPRRTSHTRVLAYTAGGTFVSMMWLGSIGVLVSSFAGGLGPVEALVELTGAFAPVAMLTIVLSTLPVSAMNIYGGSLSALTVRAPVSRRTGVVLIGLISLGLTLWMQTDPYGSFYDFLLLLGYLVVPFIAVIALDYFLGGRKDFGRINELYDTSRTIEWGFVAWIIGCLASVPFWNSTILTGPIAAAHPHWGDITYYVGAAAAAIAYLLLHRLPPLSSNRSARGQRETQSSTPGERPHKEPEPTSSTTTAARSGKE